MHLEVDDSGAVVLPPELVQAAPHTLLEAEREGNAVVLRFPAPPPLAPSRSLLDLATIPTGPIDPVMTFRREDLYGDEGR